MSKLNIEIKSNKQSYSCVILGNGPSLINVLENQIDSLKNKDLLCVNFFVKSQYYKILRPRYYVINAPELWNYKSSAKILEESKNLFANIGLQTEWEMVLFLPFSAKRNLKWNSDIVNNKFISVIYYNPTPIDGFDFTNNFLYKYGFGMPRPHNVIIPSLIIAIRLKYNEIFLLGVDHSWLKEISVDENNNVLVNQKHFYDVNTSVPSTMHKKGQGKRKLHEVLQKFIYSFKGYFIVNEFADSQDVNIYNCTPGSFIDAFERKDLNSFSK